MTVRARISERRKINSLYIYKKKERNNGIKGNRITFLKYILETLLTKCQPS